MLDATVRFIGMVG